MVPPDTLLSELAERVADQLRLRGERLALAESCTGGWIAKCLTDVVGSSSWFERGYVTYSTQSKTDCLGVAQALMIEHGAVSAEVAEAEARGALLASGADWAVCVTGVAGPGGATEAKPVGLCHFCWMSALETISHEQVFSGDRNAVRGQAVAVALQGLSQILNA